VKGGKARAAQAAVHRITHPTTAEVAARAAVATLTESVIYEYPIETAPGLNQYIDIYATIDGQGVAVEVDGSNGWHNTNGKMAAYDESKARWCHDHGVKLVVITVRTVEQGPEAIADSLRHQIAAQDIPF